MKSQPNTQSSPNKISALSLVWTVVASLLSLVTGAFLSFWISSALLTAQPLLFALSFTATWLMTSAGLFLFFRRTPGKWIRAIKQRAKRYRQDKRKGESKAYIHIMIGVLLVLVTARLLVFFSLHSYQTVALQMHQFFTAMFPHWQLNWTLGLSIGVVALSSLMMMTDWLFPLIFCIQSFFL